MKSCIKHFLVAILVTCMVAATASQAVADKQKRETEIKPIVVVSVASLDKLLADATYLTRAAGVPEFGAWFALTAPAYTEGVTKDKPSGAYVTMDDGEPKVVAFVPVDDLDTLLANLQDEIGQPRDAGDGVLEIATDRPTSFFVKEQGGWAFVSDSVANLSDLPKDPRGLLGDLDQRYSVAVQFLLENLPAELKDVALTQTKAQFETWLEEQLKDLEGDVRDSTETVSRRTFELWLSAFTQIDDLTVGWAVDSQAKSTYLDVRVTAQNGSDLAQRLSLLGQASSAHAELLPDAAVSFHFSGKFNQQDAQLLSLIVRTVGDARLQQLEDAGLDAQQFALRKDIINTLVDVLRSTVESGKFDGGVALALTPQSPRFVAGGYVADGAALERALKKAVELGKSNPDFPEIKFDVETYKGLRVHTFKVALLDVDEKTRALLGDSLEGAIAIGGQAVYVAYGNDGVGTLKGVIDQHQRDSSGLPVVHKQKTDDQHAPLTAEYRIALAPILQFMANVDDNPMVALLAAAMNNAQGTDHVLVTLRSGNPGMTLRLEVQEGVLKLIGIGVKTAMGGGGPGF